MHKGPGYCFFIENNKKKDWKKDPRVIKLFGEIADMKERMIWVGCGTKEQAEEGFRLMCETQKLWIKLGEILKEYE